jgi:glycosyltransferase involved in cell wall biosynthesis
MGASSQHNMGSQGANTVAVVMPCYNGMPYLMQALESALGQTQRPVAIVVVDDGSRDASAQTVREFAGRYPDRGIRLVQQTNAGEPGARNAGIRAACDGTMCPAPDWIAMLDSDDWWEPQKLELQLQAARDAGGDCVLVHTAVIAEMPDATKRMPDLSRPVTRIGRCLSALLGPGSIGHPSIMVRRDALEQIGGYDPSFRQACDIDLYLRLSVIGSFAYVAQPLLHYRYHAGQMSASRAVQLGYHVRAVREFFDKRPHLATQIGPERISAALIELVTAKMASAYWHRRLPEFRALLDLARGQDLDSPELRRWRRRALAPDWLIRFKDKLVPDTTAPTADPAAGAQP